MPVSRPPAGNPAFYPSYNPTGRTSGAAFDPASLFTTETGGIYDAEDRATTWQDASKTIQADTNGDPVERIVSLSHSGTVTPDIQQISGSVVIADGGVESGIVGMPVLETLVFGSSVNYTDGVTIVACMQVDGSAPQTVRAAKLSAAASGIDTQIGGFSSGAYLNQFRAGAGAAQGTQPASKQFVAMSIRSQDGDTSTADFRANGSVIGTRTGAAASYSYFGFSCDDTLIWKRAILINRRLTDEELANAETWVLGA